MRNKFLYIALLGWALTACSDRELAEHQPVPGENTEVQLPDDIAAGELIIKFKPEMTDILDRVMTRAASNGGVATRSGIPSTDEVLDILGGYHFERIFPMDAANEARTRAAGLHLWYLVKFSENTDLKEAARRISRLGEISKVQGNSRIKRAYSTQTRRIYVNESALNAHAATRSSATGVFSDPGLVQQWHYNNTGEYPKFQNNGADLNKGTTGSVAGCDVGCYEAWEKCTGDPSIVVAVLDEGIMLTHPDLEANIWVNEKEEFGSGEDNDGNGYKGDRHGYNFVENTGVITWTSAQDTGHGTHVAGTIAAMNGNGLGVCGIAGGNGQPDSGVKIMCCQVFAGQMGVTLDAEAKAIKYAADNGAVILQCSWGYNSGDANMVEGFTPGPSTQKEWEELYPLEKEALDYFIHNAGSPNGVIEGGIAVFAAGNEYAGIPAYPGAYSKCVTVSSTAADFTPASYTNFGVETDICAPGGDMEYYAKTGENTVEYWDGSEPIENPGSILSTVMKDGVAMYGYMDGTSMACPHVSGVAALGLSYAVKLRRHFKVAEFIELMKSSVKPVDGFYPNRKKTYYRNHTSPGATPAQLELGRYIGKMGTGLANAALLLDKIAGNGTDMKVPNVYVAEGGTSDINLAIYFVAGEGLSYTCTSSDESIAQVKVEGTVMKVTGVATGTARITVKPSNGSEQTVVVTVRKNANDNGWM